MLLWCFMSWFLPSHSLPPPISPSPPLPFSLSLSVYLCVCVSPGPRSVHASVTDSFRVLMHITFPFLRTAFSFSFFVVVVLVFFLHWSNKRLAFGGVPAPILWLSGIIYARRNGMVVYGFTNGRWRDADRKSKTEICLRKLSSNIWLSPQGPARHPMRNVTEMK